MAQQRVYNYGAVVEATLDNAARYTIASKGVYRGFDLGVNASGNIELSTGYGVQHNGIVWYETDVREIGGTFTPPSTATDYTVYATHDNVEIFGGAPVEYHVSTGILTDVSNGVILGWIRHPGGGVALSSDHIQNAPKMQTQVYVSEVTSTLPVEIVAPFTRTYSDTASMGANITVKGITASDVQFDTTNFVVYQSVKKAAGPVGAETFVQHIQFYSTGVRPVSYDLYVDVGSGASLSVELRDTDLNITTISGSPITSTGGWSSAQITVDSNSGVFDSGKPYELRLTFSVDVGQEIKLSRLLANFWPYP